MILTLVASLHQVFGDSTISRLSRRGNSGARGVPRPPPISRPSEEYRVPTDDEWQEFLGHFERRKVSVGACGRAFGTPCIHEHACVRCPMLWPDPAQRDRLVEIRDNLLARIAEAEREGWLGEVEGLQVSLAGAEEKLAQLDRRRGSHTTVDLGIPTISATERPGATPSRRFDPTVDVSRRP